MDEKKTLYLMIRLYCRKNRHLPHPLKNAEERTALCNECAGLLGYALERFATCPHGKDKPVCSVCTVHCFNRENRERILKVMRFSGPRMPLRHPLIAAGYMVKKMKGSRTQILGTSKSL